MIGERPASWPSLPLDLWRDTYATLHMWMQIVGKVSLALTPRVNHFWNIAFQITPRGVMTLPMRTPDRLATLTFDFIDHQLILQCSDGRADRLPLAPRTVAAFYEEIRAMLDRAGIQARVWPMPVEVPDPVRFDRDTAHRTYDAASAHAFWRVLVSVTPVFDRFRAGFVGKCSPVHFFWGSFDLAVTRFSGRRAPERPGADAIMREAYSHEVISHGFWPGSGAVQEPAFYAYAAPEPDGLKRVAVAPSSTYYSTELSEFILPYEAVRTAASPEADLTAFLHSTYAAAADLARWNRSELERGAVS